MSYARRIEAEPFDHRALPPAGALRRTGAWLVMALLRWQEVARQRRRLLALDDRMLKDIGITRADATREGTRPFWDAPGLDASRWP